jgi:excisionase family DNA binding protein
MPFSSEQDPRNFEPVLGRSVSIDHAAQLLGVSRRTIYNRIKDGSLSTLRTRGGSQRVLLVSLQQSVLDLPALEGQRAFV